MDGSLHPDDEAELLHTLSVSPEKRGVLRGFMDQRTLLARDSKSLQVPYEAEQRLWERLDEVMPAPSAAEPALIPVPVETNAGGILANSFHGARAIASAVTLFAGIGIGYFAGVRNAPVHTKIVEIHSPTPATTQASADVETNTPVYHKMLRRNVVPAPLAALMQPHAAGVMSNVVQRTNQPDLSDQPVNEVPMIASITPQSQQPIVLKNRIGGDGGGIKPIFHHTEAIRAAHTSLLQRFELRVDESFGRQFPNNAMTNVSWPLITNSSISAFFQLLPHSNLVWVGGGYGSASVTTKELSVQQGDPQSQYIPLSQDVLQADTVHKQTTYVAAMAELHLPAFAATDLTLGGGYGWANLGRMLFGEVGFHYNISEEMGTDFGIRVMRFTYDLSAEKQAAIQSAPGGLAISNAVASVGPSFNTELNAGLFFDF